MSSSDSSANSNTVVLGAGIVGLCTAYFLSESGHTDPRSIVLIDSSPKLFHCASGLAAGFLAADCTLDRLARRAPSRSCIPLAAPSEF